MLQLHYELDQAYHCCLSTSHNILSGHCSLQIKCDFWSAQWLCVGNTIIFCTCTITLHYKFSSCSSYRSDWKQDFVNPLWLLEPGLFHTIYPLFCLHPKMTNVQDLALDNVLAIYPLVLLCVVYVLVELHNHGCRPILFLWRLFHVAFLISENSWTLEHHWLMPLPLCFSCHT